MLAAGESSRFGRNKLLEPFRGATLVHHVVAAALESGLARVAVVLGNEGDRVRAALAPLGRDGRLGFVNNEAFAEGQSTSVVAGLEAVGDETEAVMFLLADQPAISAAILDRLIEAFFNSDGTICLPTWIGQRRNPVIFGAQHFPALRALTGDAGGRSVIEANPEDVIAVPFDEELPFRDVDRENDLHDLARMTEGKR